MTERKFFRNTFTITVLTEDEPCTGDESLDEIEDLITYGDASGCFELSKVEELNGKQAAEALMEQASDPGFFMIDEEGNDCDS